MNFDYCYGEQSEQYAFYRTPKVFYTDEKFRGLSSDAKTVYGILLDRVSLSAKNGWSDEEGRVFVYMTVSSIEEAMGCAHQKACGLLSELEEFGLIERKRQGLGKPDRIYVKNFIQVWNSNLLKYENHTSESMEIIPQEVWKSASNNTDISNNSISDTYPILSGETTDKDMDERKAYSDYLHDQLEMEILYQDYPQERETLDSIMDLMLDVICTKRKTIRIAGDDKPANVVKSQFLKVNMSHIHYVMDCMNKNGTKVRNIKQYLLAAIYNAPLTMNSYYQAWVNNDKAEGRI